MKSRAFGLDIGSTTIKAVWLSKEREGFVYNTSASVPTPQQGMQSESPFSHQEMAQLLARIVSEGKIGTKNVNISLPETHLYTRVIEMPVLSEKELTNAIYWEAEQYIPAPLDTVVLDHSILRTYQPTPTERKMQILLVAAPKTLVQKYEQILSMAGLTINSIEPEILSVIRGVIQHNNLPTSLVMNIGTMSTSLCILQNGIIVFNYTIPLGGSAMTRAIAADFGFNNAQAEEYKRVYGMVDKNFGGKIAAAIEPIMTSLLTEVKKALAFYNEKYKSQTQLSQVLITGGSASMPGMVLYFAQNIGVETVIANPWRALGIQNVPKEVDARGPEYTVAIGLALKEYE